ncbi:hypothetical protein [uncultured Paludibaculum sp.]|uniref:hypothetical protein n=1 Tax=uncultured Paludibaculum sp. TaxID=1765020 RepID=UPI002AABC1CF|nr:hypothetical protein [uncultured Paludibaculum sp.]
MKEFLEIPIISATMLDSAFSAGIPAIRKHRQAIRENLDPGIRFSIGRGGTVQLSSVPALDCLATAGRWRTGDADHLASAYRSAGLTKLVRSEKYGKALNMTREAVQVQARRAGASFTQSNSVELITQCVVGLAMTEPAVRSVAKAMGVIMRKVDAQLEQMKRLPGRIVRSDGPETLVVVDTGEREELRSFQSGYLKSLGLHAPGAPFVLHELSWSPDTKMSVFFPALDLNQADEMTSELEEQLKAAEEPLPEPSAALA